ncbi:DUF5801 repeats-in-toxin domain-containing protein [Erythrobacter sp. GH1-10]|uniref:DUF5801 repeats-in-toxin domain-containing protein n=1 Tax=Erythrobacter sp. GH1-10 TaxID=3349334 RepID=UPI003877D464
MGGKTMKLEDEANLERVQDTDLDDIAADQEAVETTLPAQQDVVTLPPGRTIAEVSANGRDLVITLDDGSRIVVPEGAIFVPQIIANGASIPPQTVAQLLTGNEPEPEAGTTQSSGGNFADDEGAIQAAFDIGDLLPFTDFGFPEDREEEIIPAVPDEEPEVVIQTPDNPAGVENAVATVDEDGLPARGEGGEGGPLEPPGTREETDSETTNGTIVFVADDGLSAILINGVEVTTVGQTFTSPLGTLTITSIDLAAGEVGFSYTLEDNTLGEEVDGFFEVTVIDVDGDQATASLSIIIVDDGPIAADDIGIVPAGTHAPITGDVLANDESGADDFPTDGTVTGFGNESGSAEPGDTLQGEYGTLTLNADGTYTYTRDGNTPGGVEESFEYTIVDQDGTTSTAILTIQIGDAPDTITDVPRVGDGTEVNEGALPPRGDEPVGSSEGADGNPDNDSDPTESTGATISFNSPDGVESVTLNGVAITPGSLPQTIFSDDTGTFVVTGYTYDPLTGDGTITYEYTLGDNTSGDDTTVDIDITVTDLDGDTAEDTLVISIIDDEPAAEDDNEGQVEENAPITIDVLSNDTPGADDVDPATVALVAGSLSGTGTLVNNGDGTFNYTPGPGEEGTVTFDYSITDGDGDVSIATATLELRPDSEPEGGETVATVDDDGLAGGNPASTTGDLDANADDDPADTSEASFTGTLPFDVFNDSPATISFDPALSSATATVGVETVTYSISGNTLTATVTGGDRDGTDLFTVEITDTATGAYTVTLLDNVLHSPGGEENEAFVSIDFVVADSDGDTTFTNLGIVFDDDAPTASDDADGLAAGEYGPVGGNVLSNDAQGADGAEVTSYSGAQSQPGTPGIEVQGLYGKLTIAADGTYSYTRDPGTPGGVTDAFTYTITDNDGDTATASLVITIGDGETTLDLPVAGEDGTIVDEAGLDGPPAGSDAASDSETTLGTFNFTAEDGPATVFIDGTEVTTVGQTFTGTYGTLEITAINAGSISYSYTLTTNTSGDNTSDSFVVRVEDQDDDFNEDTLEIAIVDDEPTAVEDSDSVTEDGPLVADGNVLTGSGGTDVNATDGVADTEGADGATVTGVAFGIAPGDVAGDVGTGVAGTYGAITINADGSYQYVLDNQNAVVQGLDSTESLSEVFTYTITDGDGDTSTTTVTITIDGDDDDVTINGLAVQGPDVTVDEDDLADGSSPDAGALTQSNSFSVDSPDGLETLTVGGIAIFGSGVTYPVTITGDYGTLTIISATPTLDPAGDTVSLAIDYEYELTDNTLDHSLSGEDSVFDLFDIVATDTDGSEDTGTLTVQVVDDVATAAADIDSVTEDGPLVADGNVLTGSGGSDANATDGVADIDGADQATVTGVAFGQALGDVAGDVATGVSGAYGSLTINADGSYEYTLDNANEFVQGLDSTESLTEVFTYTITDGDGDTSTATLTITINGDDDIVVINGLDLQAPELVFDEDDLPDGSSPDASQLTKTGSFTVDSPDGLSTLTVGGILVFDAGAVTVYPVTIDDPVYGILTITGVTPVTDGDGDVVSATIDYSYTLDDNSLDHNLSGEDSFTDSFEVIATDTDGSTDTASLDIEIVDDIPDVAPNGENAPVLATDDTDVETNGSDSATDSFAGLFTTDFGADGAAATDATAYSLDINGGDGTDSGLNDTLTGENILLRLNGDTIEGYLETSGDIAFTLALDTATGEISQTQLRAIEHDDPADPVESGASAATMAADLISITATVTDGDDDTDSASIDIGSSFTFEDDGPEFGDNVVSVSKDEDDLIGGAGDSAPGDDAGALATTFFFDVDFNADGPAADELTVSLESATTSDPAIGAIALTSGGDPVLFSWDASTNTMTGYTTDINDPVLTLVFDLGTGTVAVNVLKPLDHPSNDADGANDGPEIGYEDNIILTFDIVATDGDGDTVSTQLAIDIDDDSAVATDNSNDVDEGASTSGNVLADDIAGADGFGVDGAVVEIASVNDTLTQSTVDGSGNLVLTTSLGTLTLDATTGEYSYVSNANSTNVDVDDVFTYTIVDGDGDKSTATLTISVTNAPGEVSDNDVIVNEAGLADGSSPLDGSQIDADGQITVLNATGTLVYSLDGSVAGPGPNEVQIDGTYGTIVLNTQTGAYTYTLDTPFTDTVDENGTNTVNGAESFTYEVRDTNGNLIGDGSIDVSIIDDIPTARDEASQSIAEDASAAAELSGNVMANDTEGADGATVTAITIDGNETAVPQDGSDATVITIKGTYTIDMDGNWTFDPNPNQDQSTGDIDASFSYTLTDTDGDFDTATQPILITDGQDPAAGPDISLTVDDQNLADGSTPGVTTDSDSIVFTPGSDDIASIVFGDVSGLGGGLTWTRVSDVQIIGEDGGRLVVTLDLSVTNTVATVTATLNDNYDDHPTIDVDDLVALGDVDVIAEDIDGDTATATVSVGVSDDLPSISASDPAADALLVDETDLATDATADFSALFTSDANADNPGTVGGYTLGVNAGATGLVDTATGEDVVLSMNGTVVEGRTSGSNELVFTVSVDASGTVTLDQLRAVEHPNTNSDNEPVNLAAANLITLSATITDSDGDTDTATANISGAITFLDDGPALSNVGLGSSVDVDETDGLPTSDTSAASIISFTADYGEDGENGTGFVLVIDDANSGLATAVGDYPITLVQTGPVTVSGIYNDGSGDQTAFTVAINPDGTVTLTQNVALEHLIDGDDSAGEHNDTLDLAGKLSATVTIVDGDGDSDSATIPIGQALTFFDDGPSVALSGLNETLTVSDTDFGTDDTQNFADNFTFDGGEDGTQSTDYELAVVDGTASGLYETATGLQVFLFLESGAVLGRIGVDANAAQGTGPIAFVVSTDNNGNVTLDQQQPIDHALSVNSDGSTATLAADNLIQLVATITDNDGDTAAASLDIGGDLFFTDDIPTGEPTLIATLDDDALGGNPDGPDDQDPDTSNLTGTLVDPTEGFGNDGGSVAFDLGSTLPSGFRLVADPGSDGVIIEQEQGTGNWVPVVEVALNGLTGGYAITQLANILHEDDVANEENEVTFTLQATLTDGDGDSAPTSLTITVDDDTPVALAVNSQGRVDEDGLPGGIAGGVNDAPGEDTVATGSVSGIFSAGADAPLTYSLDSDTSGLLALSSGGVAVTYAVAGNTLTASAGGATVFTFTLNATTGAWEFELLAPLDHAPGGGENVPDIRIDFQSIIRATDADGDTIAPAGLVRVTVDDDSPVASNDTNSLSEDTASVGGNILTDGTADGFGGDGPGNPAITSISGFGGPGTVGGVTNGEWGTLTLNGDGSYIYNLNTAAMQELDDGEFEFDTFTYTIIDADGDPSQATLTITIDGANDAPVAVADTNWTIEDAASAITGNVLADVPHPGAPSGTFADNADTDVDVEQLIVSNLGIYNGTYGILTLSSDGNYSYELYSEAQNPTAYAAVQALDEGDAPLTDQFAYTVTDGDATDDSTLTISIFGTNDAPLVGVDSVSVSDEGLPGGLPDTAGTVDTTDLATASGSISITDVDDTTFTVTLGTPTQSLAVADGSPTGAPITWSLSPDGKTLTGTINGGADTAVTLVIDDNGDFDVTLSLPIFHTDPGVEDIEVFTVDVNVSDGTTTTTKVSAIAVGLEDDSPVAVVAADLTTTNNAGGSGTAFLDSDFDVDNNFGGDGGKVIFTADTITALEAQNLTSGLAPLEYSISTDGTVLTAVKAGTTDTVFTITLDPDTSPDQYVLDLVQTIDATSTIDFNDGGYNFVGGFNSWTGFVPVGETLGGTPVDNDSPDLLLTPAINGGNASAVNSTANIGGIGGGASVGNTETFRVDFVTDLRGNPADTVGGQNYAAASNRDHVFDGHYTVNGATALFKSSSGSQVRITAFDDPDGNTIVGDGVIDTITGMTISYLGVPHGSVIIPTSTPTDYIVNGQTFTVTLNGDGSVSVDGIAGASGSSLAGTVIGIFTADGFNSVEYTYESGGTFQIGDFGATAITNDPVSFSVPISVTDNDGDVVGSDDLDITLNPAASSSSVAATSSASTQHLSNSMLLLDDPVDQNVGSNSGPGSGSNLNGLNLLQNDLRTSEMALVAAISGAVLMDYSLGADSTATMTQHASASYDLMVIDSDFLAPRFTGIEAGDSISILDHFEGFDAGGDIVEMAGIGGESALASAPEMMLGVQAEPDTIELYQDGASGFDSVDQSAFFTNPAAAGVDQAMEALLAIEPGADALAGLAANAAAIDGLGETAGDVISDIAVEIALEQMIEGLTDPSDGAGYLMSHSDTSVEDLLSQSLEGSIGSVEPLALMDSHADEAAASTVSA